jgi:hypothetical protein
MLIEYGQIQPFKLMQLDIFQPIQSLNALNQNILIKKIITEIK